jgi:peptidoglycan/LPS O-acetylase OafA/YrhL
VRDVNRLPRHDSFGLASFFTVFGTVLPSLLFGALLAIIHRAQPGRVRRGILLAYSLLAGAVVAFSVQTLVGAMSGHFWTIAGVASLLALAVASLSFGLERLLGARRGSPSPRWL